ncbi:lipoma-preferred partner-like protein [Platysternon megacephalum]|uniref:Lipoma-preferred partner-like protein n=1 Tax=Platysternon megacephalum TaxID=55544 RepID=A0A4D9E6D7_9SAUR|nr:lipoma-preferred partner-like protein [Platysternon megacephalum]
MGFLKDWVSFGFQRETLNNWKPLFPGLLYSRERDRLPQSQCVHLCTHSGTLAHSSMCMHTYTKTLMHARVHRHMLTCPSTQSKGSIGLRKPGLSGHHCFPGGQQVLLWNSLSL